MFSLIAFDQTAILREPPKVEPKPKKPDYGEFCPESFSRVLENNIIPLWLKNSVEYSNGGFSGRVNSSENNIADKSIVLVADVLWVFSALYRKYNNPEYHQIADRAFSQIMTDFYDAKNGGFYWSTDAVGRPKITKKMICAQAFCVFALSGYYEATSNRQALSYAIETYRLIERHAFDAFNNGYIETFEEDWGSTGEYQPSSTEPSLLKTVNTHIHILEAYTGLLKVWRDNQLAVKLTNLIEIISLKFQDSSGHLLLCFDREWHAIKEVRSFGLDLETSWLLTDACKALSNEHLVRRFTPNILKLVNAGLEGLDADGGLMYELKDSKVIDTHKYWWPQAEALVALINAWKLTGKAHYYLLAKQIWRFIHENIIEKNGNEWFELAENSGDKDGISYQVGELKCPYHNSRAMLEMLNRLN